jgi:hypothetical protein
MMRTTTPGVHHVIKQCRHRLGTMIGDNRGATS